jgi:hypothetical protein
VARLLVHQAHAQTKREAHLFIEGRDLAYLVFCLIFVGAHLLETEKLIVYRKIVFGIVTGRIEHNVFALNFGGF